MPTILLIETATRICSVGVAREQQMLAIKEDKSKEYSHSTQLTNFIEWVLKNAALNFSDLDAVAVSMGPGSYTGLRIGVSAAKGICYGLDIPLIAVNSLYAIASVGKESITSPFDYYIPMIDARRMEVYNAVYDQKLNTIRETMAEIIDADSFSSYLQKGTVAVFGDGAAKCREILNPVNMVIFDEINSSAKGLMQPAQEKYSKQDFVDVAYFEPFYLKDFVAGKPRVKGLK
jgi:tRNA threonylcarbamoyladenosine biosynthesis protein TsaB